MNIDFTSDLNNVARQIRRYTDSNQPIPKATLEHYNTLIWASSNNNGTEGDNSSTHPQLFPYLKVINGGSNGYVESGARFVTFTIYPDTTGSILGIDIESEVSTIELPFNPGGYKEIPYSINSGKVIITYALDAEIVPDVVTE